MLLFSMELTDMLDMLLPLTPMDMLHMLDTPMLLDMLVPMVLTLMLDLTVPTTLARGVLMLPTLAWDKKKLLISNLHQEKSIYFPPKHQDKNGNEFQLQDLTHSQ